MAYRKTDLNGAEAAGQAAGRAAGRTEASIEGLAKSLDILREQVNTMGEHFASKDSVQRIWLVLGALAFAIAGLTAIIIEAPGWRQSRPLPEKPAIIKPRASTSAFDLNGRAELYRASETP